MVAVCRKMQHYDCTPNEWRRMCHLTKCILSCIFSSSNAWESLKYSADIQSSQLEQIGPSLWGQAVSMMMATAIRNSHTDIVQTIKQIDSLNRLTARPNNISHVFWPILFNSKLKYRFISRCLFVAVMVPSTSTTRRTHTATLEVAFQGFNYLIVVSLSCLSLLIRHSVWLRRHYEKCSYWQTPTDRDKCRQRAKRTGQLLDR